MYASSVAHRPDRPRRPASHDVRRGPRERALRTVLVAAIAIGPMRAPPTAVAQPLERTRESERVPPASEEAATPLGIAPSRDASGTSWQPDSTPMFLWRFRSGGWSLGLHAMAFAGYDDKSSHRGDDKIFSINWVMATARHRLGDGNLLVRAMLSLEPVTVGKRGYPLLLQTGESVDGMRLVDRQHPHDLFMELAARYQQPLGEVLGTDLGLELYAAPAGEPALGPPAFPHRLSAMADPLAPLGHHWQDSTHISYGVLTAGVFTRHLKLEASWFNGREPDQDRYGLDLRALDSVAARLTVNPTRNLSAQLSWARLDSPEALEPGVSVQRATGSVMWNRRARDGGRDFSLLLLVGHNEPAMGPSTDAGLGEASLMLRSEHTLFTRAELLAKTGKDLGLAPALADRSYGIASFSLGYVYDASWVGDIVPGVGFVATVDAVGAGLDPFYGTRIPWGGMVFVRLRPPEMVAETGPHAIHAR